MCQWAIQDSNLNSQTPDNKEVSNPGDRGAVHDPVHIGLFSEEILSHIPHDLKQIMTAWPDLPEHIRQTIKTLVSVSVKEKDEVV